MQANEYTYTADGKARETVLEHVQQAEETPWLEVE